MKNKIVLAFSLLIMLILTGNALAITGSIGNARMILRLETGEEIEKYVLVKNVNDVPVDIEITATGDLKDYVVLKDTAFRLNAEEEKKAYFTIKAAEQGTTETKINVAFTPDEGNGVGLSSTVIVIAQGESKSSILDWLKKDEENETDVNEENISEEENNSLEQLTGAFVGMNPVSIGLLSTTVILIIFIVLLVIYAGKKNQKNKREKRARKGE